MKRAIILSMVFMLSIVAVGCGSSSSSTGNSAQNTIVDNRTSSEDNTKAEVESSVVDNRDNSTESQTESYSDGDFESVGYIYENSIGTTLYYIVVKNNGNATVSVTANGEAKDAGGQILGADSGEIDVLGPGEESILYLYFDDVSDVDHVDYELSYSRSSYYKPVVGNISLNQTINDSNLTLVATNEGVINAQFVEAYAIFLDANNNVVYVDSTYITDNDSEIKPGATLSAQLNCYNDFDNVICYLTGRSDGSATEVSNDVTVDDFDIKEYSRVSFDSLMYYLVVRNNSGKDVSIKFNGTGYDVSGNVVAADDCEIDILGAGEESITYFYFDGVAEIEKVEYTMAIDTSPYYEPVIGELSVVQNINNSNVVLEVTNDGSNPAQYLEAYALFFDTTGDLVYADSTYVVDNDSELKPGAKLSAQLDCYENFSTVECYFTGRYSR